MLLKADNVSQIKACLGIYRAADVARAYGVHRSTITRIWTGQIHQAVARAHDFPDIDARHRPKDKAEDLSVLIQRGMTIEEAADTLGMARSTAYLLRGIYL